MVPQAIGRYQIRGELGAGGMGIVYRAYDPNLRRDVALKVIFQGQFRRLSDTKQKEVLGRFQREAQIIGSLNHHAIVPIYEFGWENGEPFIVMPLMSGGGLDERLELGPLPLDEIVRILSWLAPALDTVHQRGIVHRDLKPSNILFNEHNAPYVADFGLARLTQETTRLSKTGIPIGTALYISPEQARGDKDIDQRSDIYSLGTILFEMLTGQPPYQQPHPAALLYNHVYEPIPRLDELRTDLPTGCQAIIDCAMAKNADQRYPTVSGMVAALKAVVVGTRTPRQPNPNRSQPQTRPGPSKTPPATTYLNPNQPNPNRSQPQTRSAPSKTPPATTFFNPNQPNPNPGQQPTRSAPSNTQPATTYFNPNQPSQQPTRSAPSNTEPATTYFKQGLAAYNKGNYDEAIANYNQAIHFNPNDASAYNHRGLAYHKKDNYSQAIANYDQAIRLNPNDATAYNNRGLAYEMKGDYDQAITDYDEAIRLNPNHADLYINRGNAYDNKGDYDQAIADYDQAIRLNPDYADAYNNRGLAYHNKGDYDKAIADFGEAIRLNPNEAAPYHGRGMAYCNKGENYKINNTEMHKDSLSLDNSSQYYKQAISDFNEAIRLNPTYAAAYLGRGLARESSGDELDAYFDYKKVQKLNNDPQATKLAKENLYRPVKKLTKKIFIDLIKGLLELTKYAFIIVVLHILVLILLFIVISYIIYKFE